MELRYLLRMIVKYFSFSALFIVMGLCKYCHCMQIVCCTGVHKSKEVVGETVSLRLQ